MSQQRRIMVGKKTVVYCVRQFPSKVSLCTTVKREVARFMGVSEDTVTRWVLMGCGEKRTRNGLFCGFTTSEIITTRKGWAGKNLKRYERAVYKAIAPYKEEKDRLIKDVILGIPLPGDYVDFVKVRVEPNNERDQKSVLPGKNESKK